MSEGLAGRPASYVVLPRGHKIAGRYTIESVIGEGSQGVVYLTHRDPFVAPEASPEAASIDHPIEEERVALKVIHRHLTGDPQLFKRFEREAKILARLDGPHVVKILDFVEDDGLLAIALEHVEGVSLEARLAERRPLGIDEALEIALQICAALGAAHAAGIVHRDLKPANVLLQRTGRPISSPSDVRVRVVDFGLARMMQGESTTGLTEQGMIFGTPEYMAPEQARGDEADTRSDLYAAGVILYEMVVGQVPFPGRSPIAAMTAHLTEEPPSPRAARAGAEISAALEAVILRALSKEPLDRYRSARAFAEAIASARSEPRVIKPAEAAPDDPGAMSDTDLHLLPPTLATAATLPTHEASASLREELARVDRRVDRSDDQGPPPAEKKPIRRDVEGDASVIGTTLRSAAVRGDGSGETDRPPRPRASPPVTLADPPRKTRWIWAAVAIVAAAIGAILGAIAGTR
ncbi:MAG: serine/threonine-protein kinase [Byssovorax sp.]